MLIRLLAVPDHLDLSCSLQPDPRFSAALPIFNASLAPRARYRGFRQFLPCYGTTFAAVGLRAPLAPFTLQGTESLEIFAKGSGQPVISVWASDPAGTEIREFHGTSAIGCLPDGTDISLVKNPGGDLSTLLIVLAKGTVKPQP